MKCKRPPFLWNYPDVLEERILPQVVEEEKTIDNILSDKH